MSLIPGSRIGPYLVTAQIGAGGMGEVYSATDTRLKREVAIKVLPQTIAISAERLVRFQREAEVLASLNHPNPIRSAASRGRSSRRASRFRELAGDPSRGVPPPFRAAGARKRGNHPLPAGAGSSQDQSRT